MIKKMLNEWEVEFPGRKSTIMTSLKNVHLSHLYDKNAFDFNNLFMEFQLETIINS